MRNLREAMHISCTLQPHVLLVSICQSASRALRIDRLCSARRNTRNKGREQLRLSDFFEERFASISVKISASQINEAGRSIVVQKYATMAATLQRSSLPVGAIRQACIRRGRFPGRGAYGPCILAFFRCLTDPRKFVVG